MMRGLANRVNGLCEARSGEISLLWPSRIERFGEIDDGS